MARPTLEVADIFRRYGDVYRRAAGVSPASVQGRVMTAIETCRTAALGGHVDACDACGHQRIAYNSCANRHCPKCHSLKRAAWIDARKEELLDVEYFHGVFTVPHDVAALAAQNKSTVHGLLFRATAETLRTIAAADTSSAPHPPRRPPAPSRRSPTYRDRVAALTGVSLRVCPACQHGEMIIIERLWPTPRGGWLHPDTS